MDRLYIAASVVFVLACGAVKIILRLVRHTDKQEFAHAFLAKLQGYVESGGADHEAYGWLTHRSNKMQRQLGSGGIMAAYRPPHASFQYSNYPIILNMLPDLRQTYEDDVLSRHLAHQYASRIQDVLIRHAGSLDDQREYIVGQLKNPMIWLREGVRTILALPLSLLSWTGLISGHAILRITDSVLFTLASGLFTLIGLLGAVISIALGWEPFVQLLGEWWNGVS